MMRESPFPMLPVEDALRIIMDYAAPRDAETRSVFDETVRLTRSLCGRSLTDAEALSPDLRSVHHVRYC